MSLSTQENARRGIITDAYMILAAAGERDRIREHIDWAEDRWQKVTAFLDWVASFDPDDDPTTYPRGAEFIRRARETMRELGIA